ncbi:MAG: histidine kinase [Gammaproteobacteria bacterium]|nr:histidine kinase [Gammaproteobacteria bacterium]
MTIELGVLFGVALAYLGLLFVVAYVTERGGWPARLARHPAVLALSLGVYATTWTYYGSVGFADRQGFLFLTIYLGVTLSFLAAPLLLSPLLRLVRDYQLQSLADLLAFRYVSRYTGPLVTLLTLLGILPYMALQIRAVTSSMEVLTQQHAPATSPLLAAVFCAQVTLFAVLFGARHLQPRAKHDGLVMAIAFESIVKLMALLTASAFALVGVFGGFGGLEHWLSVHPQALAAMYAPVGGSAWNTLLLLSASAAFLLPRCFHMLFVENVSRGGLRTASWLYPLFLLLLNLPIPLILWAGRSAGVTTPPDYFLLALAQRYGGDALTLLVFIGGISAASAMLIVESLALSGMCLNHLLLPLWLHRRRRSDGDLYHKLRRWRRWLLLAVISVGYLTYLVSGQSQGLVQMGLISFVAVAQFLPGVIALLTWPRATGAGFLAGASGGMAVWFFTLMLPLLGGHPDLLHRLVPAGASPWPLPTFWSLAINVALLVTVSLATRPQPRELLADQVIRLHARLLRERPQAPTLAQLSRRLTAALGPANGARELDQALRDCGLPPGETHPHALLRLEARLERNLSGLLGPHLARSLLGIHTATGRLIEDQFEREPRRLTGLAGELDHLRRLHRQMLRTLPIGACSIAGGGRVRLWNQRLALLSGVREEAALGRRIDELPAPWADLLDGFLAVSDAHLYRIELALPDGVRWLNLHKEAVSFDPGDGGDVVLIEDLTEQRLLEAELAHTERLASIGTLAAGVAHEIGNPLTGISSLAQNLKLEAETEELRQALDEILNQSRRIQEIVSALLSFSHSGGGRQAQVQRFDLAACVRDAVRLARLAASGSGLQFVAEMPDTLDVFAERSRILQVLVNLLTNAADASAARATIDVRAQAADDGVTLIVEDRGCGIPEHLRERVFEPFFTTKSPGSGTGLGLPLVYSIVRDHGGRVRLESAPGSGTRVEIWLPQPAAEVAP